MRLIAAAATAFALFAAPARAEVVAATPGTFLIEAEAAVTATPAQAWLALTRIQSWWGSSHTYSGDASHLSLDLNAGGCWCERWGDGQSVEHGRVVLVAEHEGVRTLRVLGGLGPLQELGASAVLTLTVAPIPSGAKMTLTYRVSGDPELGLDQMAAPVDMVLMEQFQRLARYTASGSPD